MTSLGYHQSLFDGKIEVKLGYFDNSQDFAGMAVGGNVATGALGPQARIPVQVGLSAAGFGTPTLTVRARLSDYLYVKGGVARSMSPDGFEAELAANDSGLKWSVPRAKALYVGEGGYNRPSGEDKSLWIRVGGIYNTSDYRRFVDGEAEDNWGVYAAIDAQLTQPDALMPFRGVYGGFTVNYAPDEQNLFTNYYEGRVYGIGLLPNRPFDMASVVASYNGLGRPGLDAIAPTGESDDHTVSVIGSYAYRLKPGVFLQPGAGVVFNPSFYPKRDTALNLYLGVTFIL